MRITWFRAYFKAKMLYSFEWKFQGPGLHHHPITMQSFKNRQTLEQFFEPLYFRFQVFFLMFLTFTCAPVHPSTCSHFSFHVLWLCSRPFPSYYDILYFYVLSSLRSRFIPTQYISRCILVVVLQFVNWCWFSSSPILSLSFFYPLKALSNLSSLSLSSGNHITAKTNLWPSDLMSWLMSRPLTKF